MARCHHTPVIAAPWRQRWEDRDMLPSSMVNPHSALPGLHETPPLKTPPPQRSSSDLTSHLLPKFLLIVLGLKWLMLSFQILIKIITNTTGLPLSRNWVFWVITSWHIFIYIFRDKILICSPKPALNSRFPCPSVLRGRITSLSPYLAPRQTLISFILSETRFHVAQGDRKYNR